MPSRPGPQRPLQSPETSLQRISRRVAVGDRQGAWCLLSWARLPALQCPPPCTAGHLTGRDTGSDHDDRDECAAPPVRRVSRQPVCRASSTSIRAGLRARPGADLLSRLAVHRARLRAAEAGQLPHRADRRLPDRAGARGHGVDPRLPQLLPPSRLAAVQRRARHARPSSSVPTTSGPTTSTGGCSPRARWARVSTRPVRPEAGALRDASAATSSSAWPRRPPDFAPIARSCRALPRAAPARARQGRLRVHDHREGQLEARLGKQPRVLPLRRQPPGTVHAPSRKHRPSPASAAPTSDPVIVAHWRHCEALGLPSKFRLSPDGRLRTARMPLLGLGGELHAAGEAAVRQGAVRTSRPAPASAPCCSFTIPPPGTTCSPTMPSPSACCRSGPTRTQLTTKWLVHQEAVEGVDYEPRGAHRTSGPRPTSRTAGSSRKTSSASVRRATNPAPSPTCTRAACIQFVEWYSAHLQAHLAQGAGTLTEVA